MIQAQNTKTYDLETRTFTYAQEVRIFVKALKKTVASIEDIKQLIRSSGSIGANYIEANESLSKKDFYMRIKISRKEAKETIYWLKLLDIENIPSNRVRLALVDEGTQLMKIFGSIITSSKI